jgi:hypothetical protein
MLDSGISLWEAQANKNSWRTSDRTELPCMENICEKDGKAFGSSRFRALLMHISMGRGTTAAAADMAAKKQGSLLTRNERNRNIVRLDSLRCIAFDKMSNAAVMISSMRTS